MLFDVQAALAEILQEAPRRCDSCDSCDSSRPESQESRESQSQAVAISPPARVLPFAPSQPNALTPSRDDDADAFRHGRSVTGNPLTWTGRIVSLDEWRRLSGWDRHGPDGRLFCGICRAWVAADSFPHCHGGNGGAA